MMCFYLLRIVSVMPGAPEELHAWHPWAISYIPHIEPFGWVYIERIGAVADTTDQGACKKTGVQNLKNEIFFFKIKNIYTTESWQVPHKHAAIEVIWVPNKRDKEKCLPWDFKGVFLDGSVHLVRMLYIDHKLKTVPVRVESFHSSIAR